ncbi:MAG: uncharacterized membrane protein YdcZ (DUF606 family) [Candidatus Latescibacterota bacterium]|jgi:uncharacterized membrane protein YdcZ (DUF606 family)
MKIFIYTLLAALAGLFIYNISQLNMDNLFEGDSSIAAVSALASACGMLLLTILLISRKIATK